MCAHDWWTLPAKRYVTSLAVTCALCGVTAFVRPWHDLTTRWGLRLWPKGMKPTKVGKMVGTVFHAPK